MRAGPFIAIHLLVAAMIVIPIESRSATDERGWTYLIDKLEADGVSRSRSRRVFRDARVRRFTVLDYGLYPRESPKLYRGFRSRSSVAAARRCRQKYASHFERAQRRYDVPASVLAAILHVETNCGENKGRHVVLYRLARLAMANEPHNVRRNIKRHQKGAPRAKHAKIAARTKERGKYLEDTFYPEVLASFQLGRKLGIDPLGIIGSKAGAFGIPQFLPSSYLRFAVDGNANGRVSLHEPADAIHSAANYLVGYGWKPGLPKKAKRKVIWGYNRSDAYIDTILFLSEKLENRKN